MLKRVNGFTGKVGSVGFDPTKSFAIDKPPIQEKNEKNETQKPYPEKVRKSKFQKK